MEIWKDIKGYEGSYQVSDLGNVRSLERTGYTGKKINGRLLKQNPNNKGYLSVNLFLEGKGKTRSVHQLVAESFLNHEACGLKLVVDHIDNDKLNNQLNNLQVITNRENCSKDSTGKTSRYVGVYFYTRTNQYRARCLHNKKHVSLGYFNTELEASEAYNNYLKEIILKASC